MQMLNHIEIKIGGSYYFTWLPAGHMQCYPRGEGRLCKEWAALHSYVYFRSISSNYLERTERI